MNELESNYDQRLQNPTHSDYSYIQQDYLISPFPFQYVHYILQLVQGTSLAQITWWIFLNNIAAVIMFMMRLISM